MNIPIKPMISNKICTPQDVVNRLAICKILDVPAKIAVVNGCFDLLHEGHRWLFHEAYRLVGYKGLVIALVNTDESVTQLKGPGRPIQPLEERMSAIARESNISMISWFAEATPAKLIEQIKPDFLVKGAEYRHTIVPGAEFAKQVVFVRHRIPISTTTILETLGATAVIDHINHAQAKMEAEKSEG